MLRRILLFGLLFIPIFLAFLWIYPKVLPHYQPVSMALANAMMRDLSPASRIEALPSGEWQSYFDNEDEEWYLRRFNVYMKHLVYLNLALLPALLLATPVRFRERLGMLGLALPSLVVIHALTLVALVRGSICEFSAPGNFFCGWILRLASASGQLFAVVLWGLLTRRYWRTLVREPTDRSL